MMIHMISRTYKNKLKNTGKDKVIAKEWIFDAYNRIYILYIKIIKHGNTMNPNNSKIQQKN